MAEMHRQGILGSVVTLICDPGELYRGISIRMATMRDCSTTVMRFKLYLDHLEQFTLRVM